MNLSRRQFWLLLQVVFVSVILIYQSLWLFSGKTTGTVSGIIKYKGIRTAAIEYVVDHKEYQTIAIVDGDVSRYEIGETIQIRYLRFAKGTAKEVGVTAGDIALLGLYIFLMLFTGVILLLPNNIIGRKSRFIIYSQFPFIKYIHGTPRKKSADISLIRRTNLFAGYLERFMFPFIMCACVGLVFYLIIKSIFILILITFIGILWGIFRARNWAKKLTANDEELNAVDLSLNTTEE